VAIIAASLALVVFGFAMWPTREVTRYSGREVAGISRYLESGYRSRDDEGSRFVGTLGLGWQDLGLAARRTAVEEMAARLAQANRDAPPAGTVLPSCLLRGAAPARSQRCPASLRRQSLIGCRKGGR
jgi:hypothetical protein